MTTPPSRLQTVATPTQRLILVPSSGSPPPPQVVQLNQALLDAAALDDIAGIQAALAQGADINVVQDYSKTFTPLTWAAQSGYADATRFLLQHGADPNGGGVNFPPLFWTFSLGQKACTRILLRAGAKPNRNYVEDAAGEGDVEITEMLMGRMPDLTAWEKRKYHAKAGNVWLDRVAARGTLAQVRTALAAGADVDNLESNDNYGGSPLMRATGSGDLPIMRLLLQHHAKVNLRDAQGCTALMYVGGSGAYYKHRKPRVSDNAVPPRAAQIRLLLQHGADLKLRDQSGMTALMYAAQGDASATELLIEHGAVVNARDGGGRTALHWAASVRDDRSLRILLRHGARIDAQDNDGETALMLASIHPDTPASALERAARTRSLRLLLRAGANAKLKDKQGQTAEYYRTRQDVDFVTAS